MTRMTSTVPQFVRALLLPPRARRLLRTLRPREFGSPRVTSRRQANFGEITESLPAGQGDRQDQRKVDRRCPHKIGIRFARGFRERSKESLPLHLATTRGRRLAGPWGGRMGTVGVALAQAVMARGA